jgi:hypothetical protein
MADEPNMPDVSQLVGEHGQEQAPQPRMVIPLWVALSGMAVALVLAVLILSRVAGPLFGLLFPADVPVPDGSQKVEHIKPEKGSEYWIYRTSVPGMEVAKFYEDEGGTCHYLVQTTGDETRPEGVSYSVARCRGKSDSGGLTTSWEVFIAEGYAEDEGPTIFRIYKYGEVN